MVAQRLAAPTRSGGPLWVFLIALLLGLWSEGGQWQSDKIMEAAAKFVDLAAVIYGMIAVSVERGGRLMFWALDPAAPMAGEVAQGN